MITGASGSSCVCNVMESIFISQMLANSCDGIREGDRELDDYSMHQADFSKL